MSLISATVSTAFTAIVSVIFSIYLLLDKETLSRQSARVLKTYLKPAWYSRLLYFLETLHNCFRRFVVLCSFWCSSPSSSSWRAT